MEIKIKRAFSSNSTNDSFDILQMKKALNRLGYYTPLETTGITDTADQAVFDALKNFQKDYSLKDTGELRPDDETVTTINKVLKTTSGIYRWRTVGDENVRPEHATFNNTVRDWKDSPDPGEDFNCRCWAEIPDNSILPKAKDKDIMAFIKSSENDLEYMYLDTGNNVTVGIGFMLPNPKAAQEFPFSFNFQKQATPEEIKDAYNRVKNSNLGLNIVAEAFDPRENKIFLPIYLPEEFTQVKLRARLQEDIKHLRNKFSDFDDYPLNVQKALLDMHFNLGIGGFSENGYINSKGKKIPGWPKLFKAVNERDWETGAKESHRKGIGEERNKEIYNLFIESN